MASFKDHAHPTTYECVDQDPEYIEGQSANNNGALFYFTRPLCGKGFSCGGYAGNKELTCVVCTK